MDDLKNKGPQDRNRISLSEPWEVRWWCESLGVTETQLQAAVKAVGNSVANVRSYLAKK